MYFEFNGTKHAINSAGVAVASSYETDEAGVAWLENKRFTIEFRLKNPGASSVDLDAEIAALESLYSSTGASCGLYHDDGATKTEHFVNAVDCLGGVRVIQPPSYMRYQKGEYVTYRTGTVVVEATIPKFSNALQVTEWQESLDIQPSGPTYVMLQPNVGNAVRQQSRTNQFFRATQSGRIVYAAEAGPVPDAIFDQGQKGPVKYKRSDPRKIGGGGSASVASVGFAVDYTYEFEWPTDLT